MTGGTAETKQAGKRLFHPLCGADLGTLARAVTQNGVHGRGALPLLIAAGATLGRLPFSALEYLYAEARGAAAGPGVPPVFILGHWRSGTTHLYNVMSKAPHWAYVSPFATALPWDFLVLVRALGPLLEKALPEDRFIDNIPVEPDSPQEDEIGLANMTDLSYYHALYFPRRFAEIFDESIFFDGVTPARRTAWQRLLRYYYGKLSLGQGGQRLLIKNPVYTARVALLREMWPDAKFIHIHRNPYKVYVSMRNFYERLFAEFALEPYDHVDIDQVVLGTYSKMMTRYAEESASLPESQLVELRFDDFQRAPMTELAKIYERLSLPGFAEGRPRFEAYLASVADYQKNSYTFPRDAKERVSRSWAPFIERWSYSPPA